MTIIRAEKIIEKAMEPVTVLKPIRTAIGYAEFGALLIGVAAVAVEAVGDKIAKKERHI